MSASVRDAVVTAIRDHGTISFAEYMEVVLYGPGGYYERPPIGDEGDFVTSPHVHPVFAELLAVGIRQLWDLLGQPDPLRLAEVGAGDGTLAGGLLAASALPPTAYTAVERSTGARQALGSVAGVRTAEALPSDLHVVLAHELLDNLPFRRVRGTNLGPKEVRVGLRDDRVVEVLVPADEDLLIVGTPPARGEETIVPDGAISFVDDLAGTITKGYALVIDYGSVGSTGGPAHGYRGHRVIDDPLDDPGGIDITVGVDFALIAGRARERGLIAFESVTQFAALKALGYEDWVRSELARQHRFLEERDGTGALRTWSGRSRATLLVDPAALGRFRWLLLASPSLPAPNWLLDAASREATHA